MNGGRGARMRVSANRATLDPWQLCETCKRTWVVGSGTACHLCDAERAQLR